MLGKLFKYEFKNTSKVMLTIYAVLVAVTAIGTFAMSTDAIQSGTSTVVDVVVISMVMLYVLSAFALFIVTYVYMCTHFYKTMYSAQGYLTHTLPVSPVATFHVKLITSLTWMILSMALLCVSVLVLLTGASRGTIWADFSPSMIREASAELQAVMGIHLGHLIAYLFFSMLLTNLSYLLVVFASASIGQLFSQYKLVASIISGIVIYFVLQILSVIVMVINGLYISNIQSTDALYFSSFMTSGMILAIVSTLILYVTCILIVRKHINLE